MSFFSLYQFYCIHLKDNICQPEWPTLPVSKLTLPQFTFTGDVVSVNQVAVNGSNYLPPGEAEKLSTEGVKAAVWGSKMTVALEEFQLTTIWLVKACLLLMYSRLT